MQKEDQIKFIKNLTLSVADNIVSEIEGGKIPENWDGIELRELLSEKFERETRCFNRKSKRYKDYKNTVLINYL